MFNIYVDGIDGVGKSTLCRKWKKRLGLDYTHLTSKHKNDFDFHWTLIKKEKVFYDRFFGGEFVYPTLYVRDPKMTLEEMLELYQEIINQNELYIIMVASDLSIVEKRLKAREEDEFIPQLRLQNKLFFDFYNFLKANTDYDKLYLCDISKENAYEDLDLFIEENYGKQTINTAYYQMAKDLLTLGEEVKELNGNDTTEILNYTLKIDDVSDKYITLKSVNLPLSYLSGELMWYMNGRNDVEFISKFSDVWVRLSDDGKTNNSAYGYILYKKYFNQVEKVIELLKKHPTSRRAVININVPNESVIETKDEMCTIALVYHLRNGKLHSTTYMRSQDAKTGTLYDWPAFLAWQRYIANQLGVEVGTYTHTCASWHFYNKDKEFFENVVNSSLEKDNRLLDIDKLIENKEFFNSYIDREDFNKKEFLNKLREMNILTERLG